MTERSNISYLKDILEAVEKINRYIKDLDFENFLKNDLVFDGVVREFEIIGEATNNIGWEFKDKYPDIPWRDIVDMRNRLIHGYADIDPYVVWKTCQKDLPELKNHLERIK